MRTSPRWVRLFPACTDGAMDPERCRLKEQALLGNPERLSTCRTRLGSLAWFMRSLNEPIARRANREDACTGRFWEGRYRCQALLDEAAVLACMGYVDLNPIRAGMAEDLTQSTNTGAHHRIQSIQAQAEHADQPLRSINTSAPPHILSLTTSAYLELIDWTARLVRPGKHGTIPSSTPPILVKLGLRETHWKSQVLGIESRYWRAIGSAQALIDKATAIGQRWLKGIGSARGVLRSAS